MKRKSTPHAPHARSKRHPIVRWKKEKELVDPEEARGTQLPPEEDFEAPSSFQSGWADECMSVHSLSYHIFSLTH